MPLDFKSLSKKVFTLRELDLPPKIKADKRLLLKWFALSSGLISENESRDTLILVLDSLFHFLFSLSSAPSTKQIQTHIKRSSGNLVSEKLIRYHISRIISFGLVQRKKGKYFFASAPYSSKNDVKASYDFGVSSKIKNILDSQALALDELFFLYSKKHQEP